jgi:hypothetical protein
VLDQGNGSRTRAHWRGSRGAASLLALALAVPGGAPTSPPSPANLKPATSEAYDEYIRLTDARHAEELRRGRPYLFVEGLPEEKRRAAYAQLRAGEVVIERLQTLEDSHEIRCPEGIIHHWVAAAFIPGVTLEQTLHLVKDYDHHSTYYAPDVQRSKILGHDGDHYKIALRFKRKKVITVVLNTEFDVQYTTLDAARAISRARSTRIAQVEDHDTPQEHELPVGDDGGYLWRMDTYWRFLQKDGGTYVQCEAVSLTRDIPFAFKWLIGPFVTSIPRETLAATLRATRTALVPPTPGR